jgi:ATP-binding cassette subfamily C protein
MKPDDIRALRPGLFPFARALLLLYPKRTLVILSAFLLAGLMEGIGVTSLLPLLTLLTSPGKAAAGGRMAAALKALPLPDITAGIGPILAFIVTLLIAKAVISLAAMRKVGAITAAIGEELRTRLIHAVLRAKWGHFRDLAAGRSANAIGTEARRASEAYMFLGKALADTLQIAVYLFLAFFISWQIALGVLLLGALLAPNFRRLLRKARAAGQAQTHLLSGILARLTDSLAGIKAIKAMGREAFLGNLLTHEIRDLAGAEQREFIAMQTLVLAREPIIAVVLAAGLYAAVTYGGVPLPQLLVLAFMFFRVATKLTVVQSGYQKVATLESAYRSMLAAIADAESAREDSPPPGMVTQIPAIRQGIRFEHVSFSHRADGSEDAKRLVLQDVSALFPARAFSAVIGPSGAGKTTLVDLLARLYDPDSGRILADDLDLATADPVTWRHSIGYLPQECPLFHDTILNNIVMGDPAIGRAEAGEALKQAGAWEFISELPQGLETMAGERGSRFSGGQRQRIAIARALAMKPKLLLLDEPTSALDSRTERDFLETIRALSRDVTIIAITHNRSVAAYADHVFHLEKGRLEKASEGAGHAYKSAF